MPRKIWLVIKRAAKIFGKAVLISFPAIVACLIGYFVTSYAYPLAVVWFFVVYALGKGQRWDEGNG